jgi:hypothetical protein
MACLVLRGSGKVCYALTPVGRTTFMTAGQKAQFQDSQALRRWSVLLHLASKGISTSGLSDDVCSRERVCHCWRR